jgi:hypothetical protein
LSTIYPQNNLLKITVNQAFCNNVSNFKQD